MKKIDWKAILVPFVFVAALAGCAMMVGSLKQKEESLPKVAKTAQASQLP